MRGLLLVLLLLWAPAAAAQDSVRESADRPLREQRAARSSARASAESRFLPVLPPGERVTYQQVMARPDDVPLNFLYAQSQIRAGDLRGAAATLERILLVVPNLVRARLLYAAVLFRLDDLVEAEREFASLSRLELPDSVRLEAERYLREIALRSRRTRLTASVSVGTQFDSNRNAGPSSDEVLFHDFELDLDDDARSQPDVAFVGILGGEIEHDLPSEAGHRLLGSIQYYAQEQAIEDQLDLMAVTAAGGALLRTPFAEVRPVARASFLTLDEEPFLGRYGAGFLVRRELSPELALTGAAAFEYQDYHDVESSDRVFERSGFRVDVTGGLSHRLGPRHRVDLGVRFLEKLADRKWWAHRGAGLSIGYTWLLGRGQFLAPRASYEYDWYRRADPSVTSDHKRRDQILRSRITYGAPLRLLLGDVEGLSALHDVLALFSAEYFRSESNLTNYHYDNWKVSLLFTKRWKW